MIKQWCNGVKGLWAGASCQVVDAANRQGGAQYVKCALGVTKFRESGTENLHFVAYLFKVCGLEAVTPNWGAQNDSVMALRDLGQEGCILLWRDVQTLCNRGWDDEGTFSKIEL